MGLDSMDRMYLLDEIQRLKSKLNLASDFAIDIRKYLNEEELTDGNIKKLKNYASDLSDFLKTE